MSVVKVIEIICEGSSVEDALQNGLKEASSTLKYINQLNVRHVEALVENDKIVKYRVNTNVSFLVKNSST
ncbi:MAG: dodecin domain-containing protein [Parachlamydiaceae bacterium]|nr:dodecin domain-containing protein [Parachlamydiaceae bacterium]